MTDIPAPGADDHANVIIRPPLLWFLVLLSWGLDWLLPLPFMPVGWPNIPIGIAAFVAGFLLAIWSFRQFRDFRGDVDTHAPTSALTDTGPFAFSRNPIYLGMLLSIIGVAVGANTLWILLVTVVVWYPIMRWGVIAREEAYLERKFGDAYLAYKRRVRRWL